MRFIISRLKRVWAKSKTGMTRYSVTVEDDSREILGLVLREVDRRNRAEVDIDGSLYLQGYRHACKDLKVYLEDVIAEATDPPAVTFDGCLAGNNAKGLWAWPSQGSSAAAGSFSKPFQTTKWNKAFENAVLRALQAAGELGGKEEGEG